MTSALDAAKAKNRAVTYVPGFPTDKDEADAAGLAAAVEAAKTADVAVIFAGLPDVFESEGYDRTSMAMPACQNALIAAVAAAQPNTVVVLHNGSPVECPWAEDVAAILELYLGGQGVGEACDALLWGEANPCGRLAETFPLRLEDTPCYLDFPGDGKTVKYSEGVYVGYRYYEAKKLPVRWAFGHGLSYTTFGFANLKLSAETLDDTGTLTVRVDVTNTGKVFGKEVVQLYVADKTGTFGRPLKELKGFAKVALAPGETKTVSLTLTARDLSWYNVELGDWYAASGAYEVMVGHASDDIRLTAAVQFTTQKQLPLHVSGATTIGELARDPRTAPVVAQMMQQAAQAFGGDGASLTGSDSDQAMMQAMMNGMPLKSLMSFGMMNAEQLDGLIAACGGAPQG